MKDKKTKNIFLPKQFFVAQKFIENIISRKLTIVFLVDAFSFPNKIPIDHINGFGITQFHFNPKQYKYIAMAQSKNRIWHINLASGNKTSIEAQFLRPPEKIRAKINGHSVCFWLFTLPKNDSFIAYFHEPK